MTARLPRPLRVFPADHSSRRKELPDYRLGREDTDRFLLLLNGSGHEKRLTQPCRQIGGAWRRGGPVQHVKKRSWTEDIEVIEIIGAIQPGPAIRKPVFGPSQLSQLVFTDIPELLLQPALVFPTEIDVDATDETCGCQDRRNQPAGRKPLYQGIDGPGEPGKNEYPQNSQAIQLILQSTNLHPTGVDLTLV